MQQTLLFKALYTWCTHVDHKQRNAQMLHKAAARVHNVVLATAWSAWLDFHIAKKTK